MALKIMLLPTQMYPLYTSLLIFLNKNKSLTHNANKVWYGGMLMNTNPIPYYS